MVSPGTVRHKADQCSAGSVYWPIIPYTSPHMALAPDPVNFRRETSFTASPALLFTFVPHAETQRCTWEDQKPCNKKICLCNNSCIYTYALLNIWSGLCVGIYMLELQEVIVSRVNSYSAHCETESCLFSVMSIKFLLLSWHQTFPTRIIA